MLKIQKRRDDDLKYNEWEDVATDNIFRVVTEGGETIEISQAKDAWGFLHFSIRTVDGILMIFPDAANKISLRPAIIGAKTQEAV
jgi:hypothetical protein